ncbi:MAG: hypothetical protein COU98_01060 [Candidatus Staskawiczbacteria bacterium CG10_big_fil_rev_8_21_14_0_10_38_10]|uniref:EamA domain-containing protein n=1 Tax=Candidatus Staskawiczbacteria bacterium CG10_big_fil_rev_8_21_14_0_10_38_10 TaxID=1974891 RepID=A0A2H9T1R2_9BACT|nr:MAG: hypothetical protein COU98_01060 [Candidatus Staskawiczbacteria bacterium CG10_big_fil_rev_8_21_14_0_10_38_10]
MLWLIAALSSYLILAVIFLIDKYLLSAGLPNPKVYAFYVGILGISVLLLTPFVNFYVPAFPQLMLCFFAGAFFLLGLIGFYKTLRISEASRAVPAVGGMTPIFTLFLIYLFSKGKETLGFWDLISFSLLILGTVLINYEGGKISRKSLGLAAFSAFLFSFSFVLTKYVYLSQGFWSGYIWIRISGAIAAIFLFLLSKEVKEEIFKKKDRLIAFSSRKSLVLFISNQLFGVTANILQNIAFFLVPLLYVALINALQGIQYLFLFILTLIMSLIFPRIIKEKISRKIIIQKSFATILICGGVAILAI